MEAVSGLAGVYRLAVVARGCGGDLTDNDALTELTRRAAVASGLHVVGETVHAFVPHGLSVALLLAQSHLVLSTWPEHRVAIVDLVVCGDHQAAHAVWQTLQQHLRPTMVELSAQTISLE